MGNDANKDHQPRKVRAVMPALRDAGNVKKTGKMDIVVDFDGTVVTHEFPKVGRDVNAVPVLLELIANGHRLILFTMRSDVINPISEDHEIIAESGNYLTDAINWFKENDIPLYGIQTNPTQHTWTSSPKAYGQIIIDDAALGCPLTYCKDGMEIFDSNRPFVDWKKVREWFIEMKLIKTLIPE